MTAAMYRRDSPGIVTDASSTAGDVVSLRLPGRSVIPLRYLEEGSEIYLVPTGGGEGWASALMSDAAAELEVDGRSVAGAVAEVTDPGEVDRIRSEFRRKYGSSVWDRHFAHAHRVLRVERGRSRSPPSVSERIRGEFDSVAADYAGRVAASHRQRLLKERTTRWLLRELTSRDPLLEIGPGVGWETLPLLAEGHSVVAVDVAPRMLEQLRARADARGVSQRLITEVGALRDLARVLRNYPAGTFAAAYSTFGAFTLESELGPALRELARLIRPGGRLLFTSLNRPGPVPFAWELLSGNLRSASARLRPERTVDGFRYALRTHARTPAEWDRLLRPGFVRSTLRPASVLVPPFDSPRLVAWLGPEGRQRAERFDRWVSRRAWAAPLGEWSLLSYRRVGPSPSPATVDGAAGGRA